MKRIIAAVLAFACVIVLTACGGRVSNVNNPQEQIDTTKSQIIVEVFDAGYGSAWVSSLAEAFEQKYADKVFEEGKMGVQVLVRPNITTANGESLISYINKSETDVYVTQAVAYYDFVNSGYLMDLTEAYTTPLTEYGENKSVLDKMYEDTKEYLLTDDGKLYGVPPLQSYEGIIYDVDVFESYLLYFAADVDNGNDGFILSMEDSLAAGPDGVQGTVDDGLPATYDDFYRLCERMQQVGVEPILWSGEYSKLQTLYLLTALRANYSGTDFINSFSFEGNVDDVVTGFNGNEPILTEATLTPATGYLSTKQAGWYYALEFVERIIDSKYYSSKGCFDLTYSHTNAQRDFIEGYLKNEPYGMLVDGTWWENEATKSGAFAKSETTYGEAGSKNGRRFGLMPLPKAPGQDASPATIPLVTDPMVVVNANSESKREILEHFVRYMFCDESLRRFTQETGMLTGIEYTPSEEDYANMSYYQKQLWQLRAESNPVFISNKGSIYSYAYSTFRIDAAWVGGPNGMYDNPVSAFKDGISAREYFEGMAVSEEAWLGKYSSYIEN